MRPQYEIPLIYTSKGAEETSALGEQLAPLLEKGGIVALRGPLGAGKTCFIKGIARGLGIEEEITSATYTIISEYEGTIPAEGKACPVYHIDAYRLRGNDDFSAIGGEEIVFGDGISLIEWSERIGDFISPEAIQVTIEIKGNGERLIRIYREGKLLPGEGE